MRKDIHGATLFSVTPVDGEDRIDVGAWARHLDWAIAQGVHSITLFGSTGGNGSFSEAEKTEALAALLPRLAGRVPVMVGIGAMTTAETCRLAKRSAELGADAVLVVPLNYWPPTERELVAHYRAVGEASNLPLWVYNNPPLAGIDLTPSIIAKLAAAVPSIVGMKDSSGDLTRVFTIPEITGGAVAVGLGQDTIPVEAVMGRAPAWFTGLANFCPAQCAALWNAAASGDAAATLRVARALFALSEIGGRRGIIRVAHTALQLIGRPLGPPRRPLLPLDEEGEAELRRALDRLEPA